MLVNINDIETREEAIERVKLAAIKASRDLLALPQHERDWLMKKEVKKTRKNTSNLPFGNTGVELPLFKVSE